MSLAQITDEDTHTYLRSVIRRFARRRDVADIMQDTLLQALRKIGKYRPGNFKAWLAAVAYNEIRNRIRKKQTRGRLLPTASLDEAQYVESLQHHFAAPEPPDNELSGPMQAALDELPGEDRDLLLAIAEGRTWPECAEIFGVPTGTIASRLFRIRRGLRKKLRRTHA